MFFDFLLCYVCNFRIEINRMTEKIYIIFFLAFQTFLNTNNQKNEYNLSQYAKQASTKIPVST